MEVFISGLCLTWDHPKYLHVSNESDNPFKITSAPLGTQAASLDIERAYHNSPIAQIHKPYLAVPWHDNIYVGNVVVEGLATAGGIQGTPFDTLLDILLHHGIRHVFKWVDDVVIFCSPSHSFSSISTPPQSFDFDLKYVFHIMSPLGLPWHPIEKKGQDFASMVKYLSFLWDLDLRTVSLLDKKRLKLLIKVNSFLSSSSSTVSQWDCLSLHGLLQHVTFIYKEGFSTLPPLSTFTAKFPNDFSR